MTKPEQLRPDEAAGQAAERAAASPRAAQPGAPPVNREEGKEGSRGTLGPDGSPGPEKLAAQQLDSCEPPGGYLTNRPSSNTNSGGEDWFEVSLYLSHGNFETLVAVLDRARQAAEEGKGGDDEVSFGDERFIVRAGGAAAGSTANRIYFRWQLHSESGFLLQIMNRDRPHKTVPNGNLRVTSLLLMQIGVREAWRQSLAALRAMGFVVVRNKLSRVDACVDIPRVKIASFTDAFAAGHFVSRARYSSIFEREDQFVEADLTTHKIGRAATGFEMGRNALRLRVYDKIRESLGCMEKLAVLMQCRWGEYPYEAVRAEFQIRRARLKEFGVDCVADWFEKRAAICTYLCTEWFRLTAKEVDSNHPDRCGTLPEWVIVQEAFAQWAGREDYPEFEPLAADEAQPSQLMQQAVGLCISFFAKSRMPIESNEAFKREALWAIGKAIEGRDMCAEVDRRAMELGVCVFRIPGEEK